MLENYLNIESENGCSIVIERYVPETNQVKTPIILMLQSKDGMYKAVLSKGIAMKLITSLQEAVVKMQ